MPGTGRGDGRTGKDTVLGSGRNASKGGADEILDQNKVKDRRRSRTCIPTKNG